MSMFPVLIINVLPQYTENQLFPDKVLVFFSFTSFLFKLNAIKTFVFRSYTICSNYHDMHNDLISFLTASLQTLYFLLKSIS